MTPLNSLEYSMISDGYESRRFSFLWTTESNLSLLLEEIIQSKKS